jgi:hypothetical protein
MDERGRIHARGFVIRDRWQRRATPATICVAPRAERQVCFAATLDLGKDEVIIDVG